MRFAVPLVALAAAFASVSFMPRFADRLVYFPSRAHDGGTPAVLGLTYEDVGLRTADGVRLHAWFVRAPEAQRTLLFLHGNGGNISHRLDKLAILADLGADVMLLDYRGYGMSEGAPDEAGTYRDAEAAYEWLLGRGVSADNLVVYGESLGGPVATDLASRRTVGGLILESAPSSILGVAQHHYPWLPVALLMSIRYDALARLPKAKAPLLILHSPEDEIVPFAMAEALLAAANPPKGLVRLRGGHNDNFLVAAETYRAALQDFLRRLSAR
jgi:fermentation-respiration switch protein FrsA (DUF1100 family)